MADEERKPFWVKCTPCGHTWAPVYYPIEVSMFAKIGKRAVCPMCGARGKDVLIAKQHDGKLLEPSP